MTKDIHGYPCEPRKLHKTAWFYEGKKGIEVYQSPTKPNDPNAISATIPWARLCDAVDHHRALKTKSR